MVGQRFREGKGAASEFDFHPGLPAQQRARINLVHGQTFNKSEKCY
jgi:hypothetical protein